MASSISASRAGGRASTGSPAGMVARVPGCASAPPWAGAVESPGGASSSGFKVCTVNVEGSRMREIRTYGLMRGCWLVRLRTAGWGLLHRISRMTRGYRAGVSRPKAAQGVAKRHVDTRASESPWLVCPRGASPLPARRLRRRDTPAASNLRNLRNLRMTSGAGSRDIRGAFPHIDGRIAPRCAASPDSSCLPSSSRPVWQSSSPVGGPDRPAPKTTRGLPT